MGGFEPQLKFIKFGHFYFTFRNKKKPRDIAQSIIFKWLTSKLVKIIFKNISKLILCRVGLKCGIFDIIGIKLLKIFIQFKKYIRILLINV